MMLAERASLRKAFGEALVELGLPIKLIGVGERAEDLHKFDRTEFVEALF